MAWWSAASVVLGIERVEIFRGTAYPRDSPPIIESCRRGVFIGFPRCAWLPAASSSPDTGGGEVQRDIGSKSIGRRRKKPSMS